MHVCMCVCDWCLILNNLSHLQKLISHCCQLQCALSVFGDCSARLTAAEAACLRRCVLLHLLLLLLLFSYRKYFATSIPKTEPGSSCGCGGALVSFEPLCVITSALGAPQSVCLCVFSPLYTAMLSAMQLTAEISCWCSPFVFAIVVFIAFIYSVSFCLSVRAWQFRLLFRSFSCATLLLVVTPL